MASTICTWRLLASPPTARCTWASIDSQERTRLFASESPAMYAAPGYLLFNRGNAVFAQPFDPGSAQVHWRADPLVGRRTQAGGRVIRHNFESQREQDGEHRRVSNRRARLSKRQHCDVRAAPSHRGDDAALVQSVRRLRIGRPARVVCRRRSRARRQTLRGSSTRGRWRRQLVLRLRQDAAVDLQHRAGQLDADLVARRYEDRLRLQAERQVGRVRKGLRWDRPGGVDCRIRTVSAFSPCIRRRSPHRPTWSSRRTRR